MPVALASGARLFMTCLIGVGGLSSGRVLAAALRHDSFT
jgi:hypothetical protein